MQTDVTPPGTPPRVTDRILVLGGARSGKSWFAEMLASAGGVVDYLATSARDTDDPEWEARVVAHQRRRPPRWQTIETLDVATELGRRTDRLLLVDCLTVWLTRQMDLAGSWDESPGADEALRAATCALVSALGTCLRPVVLVSNEVGQGVVPASASGRRFRDEMGILNAQVAGVCDQVFFCTAGLPQRLK